MALFVLMATAGAAFERTFPISVHHPDAHRTRASSIIAAALEIRPR